MFVMTRPVGVSGACPCVFRNSSKILCSSGSPWPSKMSLAASESDDDIDRISMAIQDVTEAASESDTAACLDGGDFAASLLVGCLEGVPLAWGMATSQHNGGRGTEAIKPIPDKLGHWLKTAIT
jgi:hypothetical protein